jgi:hypothetical protein
MPIRVDSTAVSAALTAATGTSSTLALTNSGCDVFVMVCLRDVRTAATATATYGGDAMTADSTRMHTSVGTTADLRTYVFRKTNALGGAQDIVVTLNAAADYWAIFGASVSGLSHNLQPNITGGADDEGGTAGTDPNVTMTTTVADTIQFDAVYNKTGTSMTAGSGQTIIGQVLTNAGSDRALGGYIIYNTAGSKTSSWPTTTNDEWCMSSAAYSILPINANQIDIGINI